MTSTITIQKILNKTDKEHSQSYVDRYVKWCEGIADGDMIYLQQLLANTAISVYFLQRFEDLEHQALEVLRPQYNIITVEVANRIYNNIMIDLFAHYSKPLLDAAKKLNIIGKNDYNDPTSN